MAKVIQRAIKYYYYLVEQEKKEGEGKPEDFNLAEWLIKVNNHPGCKTVIHLRNFDVRLEVLEKDIIDGNQFYFARIYKVRDVNIPVKLADGDDAQPIELEEDEYLGEDLNILYDFQLNVCMIQRNRMSIGVSGLSQWAMHDNPDYNIVFRPLGDVCNVGRFRKKKIRSLDFTLGNIEDGVEGLALKDIIKGVSAIGGLSISVSIGVGRKKDRSLSNDSALRLIEEITDNKANITRAKVKVKDDDDAPVETVDLIENFMNDIIEYDIPHKSTLDFTVEKQQMLRRFLERREEIAQKVHRV